MKTKQAVNPYLPSWEYVPDAEPHIVDGRVYIYGSHDLFNGLNFCLGRLCMLVSTGRRSWQLAL